MKRLSKTVLLLSAVSFFTDFSSEMIYPLLPVFLSSALGAGAISLGFIEGTAESTAAFFKVLSGMWADRTRRRKPMIVAGYSLAGIARPLIGLATAWPLVFCLRFMDRVGKGLRTSPRDALIADCSEPGRRGAAFGFHRSADHAGAVMGPLAAAALLGPGMLSLQHVFLLAAAPAAVVIFILVLGVREKESGAGGGLEPLTRPASWGSLGKDFKLFLLSVLVFTLGNSTDAFLLLRLSSSGIQTSWIAILWSAHHVVKMVAAYFGGRLSDKLGSRAMILMGWALYALVYAGFALFDSPTHLVVLFLIYGIYFGLTEPSEKAWVVDLVPAHLRGTAFGFYHGVIGFGALPASLFFGVLWHELGASAAFLTGAALGIGATLLLLFVRPTPESVGEPSL